MWLQAPVVEPEQVGPARGRASSPAVVTRQNTWGTPQGGVISPLLSNIYLHWFEKAFYRGGGPHQWAQAHLVRYADDFVVLAKTIDARLVEWIEHRLGQMHLALNAEKTRIVKLREAKSRLDFLGYTFSYFASRFRRGDRCLHIAPSQKAVATERAQLRHLINRRRNWLPIPDLVTELNRHLCGWGNAFSYGYPAAAFNEINQCVVTRLTGHLRRRSQRPFRFRVKGSRYRQLQSIGVRFLRTADFCAPPPSASGRAG
jgi:RNA-directed DNA polymerase